MRHYWSRTDNFYLQLKWFLWQPILNVHFVHGYVFTNNKYDQFSAMWQLSLRSDTFSLDFSLKCARNERFYSRSWRFSCWQTQRRFSCQMKEFSSNFRTFFFAPTTNWIYSHRICIERSMHPMGNTLQLKCSHVDINSMESDTND